MNDHGCWTERDEVNSHDWDKPLSEMIIKLLEPKNVVDIGCGNGGYTMNFLNHGIDCKGFDGSPLTPEITGGLCQVKDFSEPVDVGKYDLVLSLEVGEHIPLKYESIFIDNLVKASRNKIVLSWAIVGQDGFGHVNCRDNYYVIGEMQVRGLKINHFATEILRNHSTFPWFKNTIMVFSWK